jgi:hypothetical protein
MVEKRWKNVTYCLALFPMNLRVVPGLAAWIACSIPSTACGPFFPDTVLDQPQASLGVPPFSYLSGLAKLAGRESPGTCRNEEVSLEVQIPLEVEELQDLWRAAGVAQPEIEARVKHYEAVRKEMLGRVLDVGLMEFKTKADVPLELVERPLGPDFPSDIADYTEGARLHGLGKTEEARAVWQEILERPAADRRLRSVWAAWMLAKTSADLPECLAWYERVEKEAAGGATDVLGLAGAAMSWRAARLENPIEGIRLFFEAYQHGKNSAARDLRGLVWRLIEEKNPEKLALAAGDPILRSLVNLEVQASNKPAAEWLAALEAHAPLPLADGSRIAWALYSNGRYSEAQHCWISRRRTIRCRFGCRRSSTFVPASSTRPTSISPRRFNRFPRSRIGAHSAPRRPRSGTPMHHRSEEPLRDVCWRMREWSPWPARIIFRRSIHCIREAMRRTPPTLPSLCSRPMS